MGEKDEIKSNCEWRKWTRVFENIVFFHDYIDSTHANNSLLIEAKLVTEKIGEFLRYQDITFQFPWKDSTMKCTLKHLLLAKYRGVRAFAVRVLDNQYTIQILISVWIE